MLARENAGKYREAAPATDLPVPLAQDFGRLVSSFPEQW